MTLTLEFWKSIFQNSCICGNVGVKLSIGHISGLVVPIDMKWKGSALVGYWVNYLIFTFDLTHDPGLEIFKVKFPK